MFHLPLLVLAATLDLDDEEVEGDKVMCRVRWETRGDALQGGSHGGRASRVEELPWIGIVDCITNGGPAVAASQRMEVAAVQIRRNGGRWHRRKKDGDGTRGRGRVARRKT
ncbi:hypothetical protein HN51_050392 [Arachis hypogaea]